MAEERMTDDPFKPKPEDIDEAAEALGFTMEEGDENYDEDLVGLTPSKLQEELEKRRLAEEKARREYKKLMESAANKRKLGDFAGAEIFYAQAAVYGDEGEAISGLWAVRTEEFTSTACFLRKEVAEEFASADSKTRARVLKQMEPKLRAELAEYEGEATPLREEVEAGMEKRRGAFRNNRNYWLTRFLIALGAFAVFAIACAVASDFIVRTRDMTAPIVTAVFGGLALIAFVFLVFMARKLYVAQRLVSTNEKLTSTESGTRLKELDARIALLTLAIEGYPDVEWEDGEIEPAEDADDEASVEAPETESEAPMSEE